MVSSDWSQADWTSATAQLADLSLMQTWEYGQARALTGAWEPRRVSIARGERTLALAQLMVRAGPLGRGRLAWVSRGPLALGDLDVADRIEVLGALRRHCFERERSYLRLAPAITFSDLDEQELVRAGYARTGAEGWASATIDLSLSLEELRARLRPKWRNALSRSERLGVEVAAVDLETFIAAYDAEPPKPGYVKTLTGDLLRAWQVLLPDDRGLIALEARHDDDAVAWVLLARYGAAGEYLAAVNAPPARAVNANRRLLWESIRLLKADCRRWFDLGGLDPDEQAPGFSRFKAGVAGAPYKLGAELEARGPGLFNQGVRLAVRRSRG